MMSAHVEDQKFECLFFCLFQMKNFRREREGGRSHPCIFSGFLEVLIIYLTESQWCDYAEHMSTQSKENIKSLSHTHKKT